MKNIVFIPYIKRNKSLGSTGVEKPRWDSGYDFGIASWENWCKKHNCELMIMDEPMLPESEMLITWQRWNVLEILEHNDIEYDQNKLDFIVLPGMLHINLAKARIQDNVMIGS